MTALDLLRRSLTPAGYVASPEDTTNYRRVWARDGVICGLAGLASGDADLARGLRATLQTLADHLGPEGQVPSNVAVSSSGETEAVSYGGLAGRVDAGPWFVLGVALYSRLTGDRGFAVQMAPAVGGVLRLLRAWEFNARGLVYVPQSGDWADEYDLHGYLLFDQALRLLALQQWAPLAADNGDAEREADDLRRTIEATFWPREGGAPEAAYHPEAFRRALGEGAEPFPFAGLTPGGYARRFDALGSAVALLAGLWRERSAPLLDHGLGLARGSSGLVPAFDPVIREGDAEWDVLRANVRDRFSNRPGHYHNGGAWPMVNGWWVAALAQSGREADARGLADALAAANRMGGFPEYLDPEGAPHGTTPLAWSAAGEVLAGAALDGRLADWWSPPEAAPAPAAPLAEGGAPEVVVAGEILVDLLSAEPASGLGEAAMFERHAGGSAANLATNLARLGVPTALVASVGDDGFGRFLRRSVEATGVDARLQEITDSPTSVVTVTRTDATPDFALFRHADRRIAPGQLPDSLLASARLFHTSGFALSREPARTTLLDGAARASAAGATLSIDLNVAPRSRDERTEIGATARVFLALGPLAKASRDDAERLFGETLPDDAICERLLSWGATLVCLTRGSEGALVAWDGGHADVAAEPLESVADATGAGDAFWAGFLAAWLRGLAPEACARSGGRLAALKLARVGPLPDRVDPETVFAAARQRPLAG